MRAFRLLFRVLVTFVGSVTAFSQNSVEDPDFDARIKNPAYTNSHPMIMLDRGHFNLGTAVGKSIDKYFAEIFATDGYAVVRNDGRFQASGLRSLRVLVVAVPSSSEYPAPGSALTHEEVETVASWVDAGGALLLIFDHYPLAAAVETLANRFGVQVQLGAASDDAHALDSPGSWAWTIEYTRKNGFLSRHPITEGRNQSERLNRVVTFGGSSLSAHDAKDEFLKLSASARNIQYADGAPSDAKALTAQGAAFHFGRGRVVMLADANTVAAQVAHFPNARPVRIGMGREGSDNLQLLLNIVHWLSGLFE